RILDDAGRNRDRAANRGNINLDRTRRSVDDAGFDACSARSVLRNGHVVRAAATTRDLQEAVVGKVGMRVVLFDADERTADACAGNDDGIVIRNATDESAIVENSNDVR